MWLLLGGIWGRNAPAGMMFGDVVLCEGRPGGEKAGPPGQGCAAGRAARPTGLC